MAERLLKLCQGRLETGWATGTVGGFRAKIMLPTAENVSVLVIDDNDDTRKLFKRYLTGSHYHFVGASDARQGLALAEQVLPHMILLDVMMSEQDWWTLLGQLREHPKTLGIPVIVCTILSQEELALALGAAAFIRKPVSRPDLLAVLDRLLDLLQRESR